MPTFTSGNDTYLVHTAGTFDLDFLAGDDSLTVQGGTLTTAHMGDGNDVVQLKSGLATIFGDAGSDRFEIYSGNATVDGGADNDLFNLRGGSGQNLTGGLGDDRFNFYAGATSVTLHGNDGDDDFFGYYHSVSGSLYGDDGDDYFVQFVTGAILLGGLGNDIYRITVGTPANPIEFIGEGTDSVQIARGASYTLPDNIENISVQGFSGSVLTAATLTGNALNNTITAHNNDETLNGLDGNDSLSAKGGNDTLNGGVGNDYLDGGVGNDTINGDAGNDTLQGRTGDDLMTGGAGDDNYYIDSLGDVVTENSGEGTDTVRVSVSGYSLAGNVENGIVQSGAGGLLLQGNSLDNQLTGSSGDDTLYGNLGHDTLKGGAGNDTLGAGTGSMMYGGSGDDTYEIYNTNAGAIIEIAGEGTDTVVISSVVGDISYVLPANVENGDAEGDDAEASDSLTGNELNNSLFVSSWNVATLHGGGGNDLLSFSAEIGQLYGESGDDTLMGGFGDDLLVGGTGADTMTGGSGKDRFIYSDASDSTSAAHDQITDFAPSGTGTGDRIDLSLIDADTSVVGNQAFSWNTTTPTAHGLWFSVINNGNGTFEITLFADVNGDTTAELEIHVHQTGSVNPGADILL